MTSRFTNVSFWAVFAATQLSLGIVSAIAQEAAVTNITVAGSITVKTNVSTDGEAYVDADEDNYLEKLVEARNLAEANRSEARENGYISNSRTATRVEETVGGSIFRVWAGWNQENQILGIDLSDYRATNGYVDGKVTWHSIKYHPIGAEELIPLEKPLVVGITNVVTFDFTPSWSPNAEWARGFERPGDSPNHEVPVVTVRKQTSEVPENSLQDDPTGIICPLVGSPINVVNGNKSKSHLDLVIPTPGLPLAFTRSYNSLSPEGWSHNYEMTLTNKTTVFDGTTNTWKVLKAGAETLHFKEIATNLYQSPLGTSFGLEILTNGEALVTFGGGRTTLFGTNDFAKEIGDGFGNEFTITYTNDATAGTVVSRIEHNNGLGLDLSYVTGMLAQVETPSTNLSLSFSHDSNGHVVSATRSFNGQSITDHYAYQESVDGSGHNLITHTDAVGVVYSYSYKTNESNQATSQGIGTKVGTNDYREVHVEYPTNSLLSRQVTFAHESGDRVYTYYRHPVFNAIESIVGPNPSNDVEVNEIRVEFDDFGIPEAMVVADWGAYEWTRTELAYDGDNNITNMAFGLNTESPSNVWNYTWDTNFHTIASITDPQDRSIEFDYTNGLISEVRLMVDSSNSFATTYAYTTNGLLSAVSNANGNAVAYTYDTNGYPNLITPDVGPEIDLDYNILGHLEKITLPGPPSSPGQSGTRVIDLEPDGLGRVTKITYPSNNGALFETFAYDGVDNLLTNVDMAGRIIKYTYEPLGFLSSVTRQLTDGASNQNVTISFAYDQQFSTLEIEDALNRSVESYVLDELGRVVTVTNLENDTMVIDYGVGDYVNSIIRFDQSQVAYEYDYDGRLEEAVYSDEANAFTYFRNDLLRTATNSSSTVSNSYNSVNRLTKAVAGVGGLAMTNQYTYYPAGQVSNVTALAGSVTYSYDAAERLTNLTNSLAGSFDYSYNDDNGLVATIEFPNGIDCAYSYDIMDRITGIEYSIGSSGLEDIEYAYSNETGMILNRSRESRGFVYETDYTYDTLDRLTGETLRNSTGAVLDTATYAYDLAGNRTNKTRNGISVAYSLGSGNLLSSWSASGATAAVITVSGSSTETVGTDPRFGERTINDLEAEAAGTNFWHSAIPVATGEVDLVAAIGDMAGNVGHATNSITLTIVTNVVYGHDEAGNVTNISYNSGDQELDLVWNAQYQLASAGTNGTIVETYAYDAVGRRVATVSGAVANHHFYDGVHCIADVDTNGYPLRTYTYGPGIDNILAMTVHGSSETNTYYFLTDHLGSVLAITDSDGDVIEIYDYDAWGRMQVYDGENLPLSASAIGNRFAFQGREIAWATGLYYFRARWYDPITGRWLSKDPIGISGGLNQYVAFGNNPASYQDPTGLDIWVGEGSTQRGGPIGALHENLNIGDPNGEFVSYSFGTDNALATVYPLNKSGKVYVDEPPRQIDYSRYLKTTHEQDVFATWMVTLQLNERYPYRLWGSTCIPWVNQMFDFFKEDMKFGDTPE